MKPLVEAANDAIEESESVEESCETKNSGDSCEMTYHGKKIRTVEELLIDSEVDLRIWEVVESTVNNWEVAGKYKKRYGLWKTGLRQIKVKLRRKAPKIIQDGIKLLVDGWSPTKNFPKPTRSPRRNKHLIAFHLNDAHFGKRCWAPESGDNYDLNIADETYRSGFSDLLDKSMRYAKNVDRFWLRIGDDFFHVNDRQSRTGNETRVESTDDRLPKVFSVGTRFWIDGIKKLMGIAPVDIDWIPGNHDPETSYFLATVLFHVFEGNKHVTVDLSHRARKYRRYGVTVVGMCHGEKVKENKLPSLMMSEARHLLDSEVQFREWHLAHLHLARETEFRTEDSLPNTTIRRFPSLCGTDGWHDQQGFVDTYKMAEASIYSFDRGPEARFVTHA